MNRFELYSMIFYVLDAAWDNSQNEELGMFLSAANPFLFADVNSADPAVYDDFCSKIPKEISVKDSYNIANDYVASLKKDELTAAFHTVSSDEWIKGIKEYLSTPHKC